MNKQFAISAVVVLVMLMAFGTLVHDVLLRADYEPLTHTGLYRLRDEQVRNVPLMIPAHSCAAIAIVWLYRRGRGPGPWLPQGLMFGLALAAIMPLHKFLIYYTLQPLPGVVAVKQIIFDGMVAVLIGIVVARLNR